MPIYEYRCDSCGVQKEHLQKQGAEQLTDCPHCNTTGSYKKQLTAAGFQLKGSGWYATDFKGGGAAKEPAKAEPPPCAGGTGACPCAEAATH